MFYLCAKMKWAHLPNPGGLYQQDPELISSFEVLFAAIDKHEREEHEKQQAEARRNQTRKSSSSRSGRVSSGGMRRGRR